MVPLVHIFVCGKTKTNMVELKTQKARREARNALMAKHEVVESREHHQNSTTRERTQKHFFPIK